MIHRYLLIFFICLKTYGVVAQEKNKFSDAYLKSTFIMPRLYIENDFLNLVSANKDHNYTGGARFEINVSSASINNNPVLNPMKGPGNYLTLSIGGAAFTPRNLRKAEVDSSDRPYAYYRYYGLGATSYSAKGRFKLSYEIQLGVYGKEAAKKIQTYIHRNCIGGCRAIPQGWHHQIANGGAFAFNINLRHEWVLNKKHIDNKNDWLRVSNKSEVVIGQNLINAATGVKLSFFNINQSPFDIGEPTSGAGGVNLHDNIDKSIRKKKWFGFYAFVTPRVRVIAHNASLTGQLLSKPSDYTIPYSSLKNIVAEYDAGLNLKVGPVQAGYILSGRSKEFTYQSKTFHHWGGIYISGLIIIK